MQDEQSYEAKIEAAKAILKELSAPDLPLDKATALYKDGTRFLKEADEMLENARLEYEEHQPQESA